MATKALLYSASWQGALGAGRHNSVVEFYDTMPPMIPETYAGIIPTPKQCNFCRFWQADADGLFGVCLSDGFAAKVFAERDEGSPIKTAEDFECPYWERGYE